VAQHPQPIAATESAAPDGVPPLPAEQRGPAAAATAPVSPDGETQWRELLAAGPTQVRAALRRMFAQPGPSSLILAATPARWTRLLGAWIEAAEAARLARLLVLAAPWRLGAPEGAPIAAALGEAALRHLATEGREVLHPIALAADLLAARAALDGLAPQAVSRALRISWPLTDPVGADRAWLDGLLRDAFAAPAEDLASPTRASAEELAQVRPIASPDARPSRRGVLERRATSATPPDTRSAAPSSATAPPDDIVGGVELAARPPEAEVLTATDRWAATAHRTPVLAWLDGADLSQGDWAAAQAEPAWLAAQLRQRGRSAPWRRKFAEPLEPVRLAEIAALWLPQHAAAALAGAAEPGLWPPAAHGTPDPLTAARLREWLLAELLTPAGLRVGAVDIARGLLARVADAADVHVAVVARAFAAAAAQGPSAWLLRQAAEALADAPQAPAMDSPPGAARRLRLALRSAPPEGLEALARTGFDLPVRAEPAELRRIGRAPALRARLLAGLSPLARVALVQPWLTSAQAGVLLDILSAAADLSQEDAAAWDALLAAVLGAAGLAPAQAVRPDPALPNAAPAEPEAPSAPPPAASSHAARAAALVASLPERLAAPVRTALELRLSPAGEAMGALAGLGEPQRRDLLRRLRPSEAEPALAALDLLAAAATRAGLRLAEAPAPGGDWRWLWADLVEEGRRFDPAGFTARWLAARAGAAAAPDPAAASRFVGALAQLVARAGGSPVAAALDAARAWASAPSPLDPPTQDAATPVQRTADAWPFGVPAADQTLYVANAGLVLVGPFLRPLFTRLELTQGAAFVDDAAAERAAHLLQFVVDGREGVAEHEMVLNKLLCGLPLETPLDRAFQATERERETIEGLLTSLIGQWSILGRTSVAGLRESFLQRQGALTDADEAWRLLVEPRAFDMLIDRIPWGFSTLKLPWMAKVLHVDWR
ncbi:MAG TPA: contractile injection system tape measure protein, partial [Phenylobacterium sp.]